jgi:hypothetical protein
MASGARKPPRRSCAGTGLPCFELRALGYFGRVWEGWRREPGRLDGRVILAAIMRLWRGRPLAIETATGSSVRGTSAVARGGRRRSGGGQEAARIGVIDRSGRNDSATFQVAHLPEIGEPRVASGRNSPIWGDRDRLVSRPWNEASSMAWSLRGRCNGILVGPRGVVTRCRRHAKIEPLLPAPPEII